MKEELDGEMKEKIVKELKDLGVDEKDIDDSLIWVTKMVGYKLMKLRLILSEKGFDEEKTKNLINKLVDKAFAKDLDEIKHWHEEHEEHKHCC